MKHRAAGRPPKPAKLDPAIMDAARAGLTAAARRLASRRTPTRRARTDPLLADAVLAVRLAEALELLAADEVARARDDYGLTWTDIGAAFDTSPQSAHTRFHHS